MAKLKSNQFEYRPGLVITERPILFQTDMVQAILEDRKKQTRREIKGQPTGDNSINLKDVFDHNSDYFYEICRYGKPGDLLWVRESFYEPMFEELNGKYYYKADLESKGWKFKWKPSIHMPKDAARIWLMVEEIRVERLQDISEEDAIAEGISHLFPIGHPAHEPENFTNYTWHGRGGDDSLSGYSNTETAKESFQSLWYSINGEESWNSNPWVWVVKFRVLSKTGRPSREEILSAYYDVTSECNVNQETAALPSSARSDGKEVSNG